jgi:DNA-binding NtrC family response regulator
MSARVLVVEDDRTFRTPLRAALTTAGFTVLIAESAEAAEEVLALEPVDVVLSDVGLPGMDGLTLARRHPDTPFVMMSGSPPTSPAACPDARVCLEKPFEIPRLLNVLASTMRGEARARS